MRISFRDWLAASNSENSHDSHLDPLPQSAADSLTESANMNTLPFKVGKCPSAKLALTNKIYFHPDDVAALDALRKHPAQDPSKKYVKVKDFIFTYDEHEAVKKGVVGFTSAQRRTCALALDDELALRPYSQRSDNMFISTVEFEVDYLTKKARDKKTEPFPAAELAAAFIRQFAGQFLTVSQKFVLEYAKQNLQFVVQRIEVADLDALTGAGDDADADADADKKSGEKKKKKKKKAAEDAVKIDATEAQRGVLLNSSAAVLKRAHNSTLVLSGGEAGAVGGAGLLLDWDFEKMGIGGLDAEFNAIFRRAFASRIYPPAVMQKLGITHVRGLLLYGPPGTGKTLMARQIGKMLNGKEPKIVSGPEVLNKFVGQSEENIRNLFADAEAEQAERGLESDLHIIIMDELDAICRARGSTTASAGVGDTVVNQLLAKIDGVEPLHNILVIGMTNRKELIDPALMRPGRLEVHVEIALPDANGRAQILNIHTKQMRENGFLDEHVDLDTLARTEMKNYSGAEIEGVVKAAASYAMQRQVNPSNLKDAPKPDELRVTQEDFERGLTEIKPAFGISQEDFANSVPNGIVPFSDAFVEMQSTCRAFVEQVHHSRRTPLVSLLLDGARSSGKTALAATLALESQFPFVKLVTPDKLVGLPESARVEALVKAFDDAFKSPLSVLVIDDIERLIDYVPSMPARFSNTMLQALAVLLRRPPPKNRRLLIIGTCANRKALRELQLSDAFDAVIRMVDVASASDLRSFLTHPSIAEFEEGEELDQVVAAFPPDFSIGVKKLIMLIERARQGPASGLADRFILILKDFAAKSAIAAKQAK